MSVSCVGTCSACGVRQFWLSDTLSLQLDDGSLKCLPHPAEGGACEQHGLTLWQASDRGRLYDETFYVCRQCGRDGEIIRPRKCKPFLLPSGSVWSSVKIALLLAAVTVPLFIWLQSWPAAIAFGAGLAYLPVLTWRENRKAAADLAARGFPRADAPGRIKIDGPAKGCDPGVVVGRKVGGPESEPAATGPCCDQPDWIPAFRVRDEDRVPCYACGRGVMTVSEHSVH